VTPVEIKEIVYQAVAYLGIGRVFPFLHAVNNFLTTQGNGNDKLFLIKIISHCLPFIGYSRSLNALRCVNEAVKNMENA
jgi:hypothetical protein